MLLISTIGFYGMGKDWRERFNQEEEDSLVPEARFQGLVQDDSEPAVPRSVEEPLPKVVNYEDCQSTGRWYSHHGKSPADLSCSNGKNKENS